MMGSLCLSRTFSPCLRLRRGLGYFFIQLCLKSISFEEIGEDKNNLAETSVFVRVFGMIGIKMKKHKKKRLANDFGPYRENLSIIKLLCLPAQKGEEPPFDGFQKEYNFPITLEHESGKFLNWSPMEEKIIFQRETIDDLGIFSEEEMPAFLNMLKSAENDFKGILRQKVNLPQHFHSYLFDYLVFGIINAPVLNFSFSLHKTDKNSTPDELLNGGSKYISVNVYAPFSPTEKDLMFEFLDKLTKLALHNEVTQKRKLHVSDKDLMVTNMASTMAKQPKNVEEYEEQSYLSYLHKSNEKGDTSDTAFNEARRKNKYGISKAKRGMVSEKIAKDISDKNGLKIKKDNLRKIKSRTYIKRSKLFKKQ